MTDDIPHIPPPVPGKGGIPSTPLRLPGEPLGRWRDMATAAGYRRERLQDLDSDMIEDRCDIIQHVVSQVGMTIKSVDISPVSGFTVIVTGENMLLHPRQASNQIVRQLYERGYYVILACGRSTTDSARYTYNIAPHNNLDRMVWEHRPGKGHPDYLTERQLRKRGLD